MINLADLPQELIDSLNILDLSPLTVFQFALQIDGHPKGSQYYIGFNRISGLSDTLELRDVMEGGHRGIQRFPRRSRTNAVTLIQGMTFSRFLWDWYQEAVNWTKDKPSYTRNVSIYMLHRVSVLNQQIPFEVWQWQLIDAFPSEWNAPEFNAHKEEQAFQRIVLQHSGMKHVEGLFSGSIGDIAGILQ